MELNPFERSFATKDNGSATSNENTGKENDTAGDMSTISNNSKASTNKHNLHIPNISSLNDNSNKLPGITPPLFTPGGRRLPPLSLSPNGPLSNPGTPGTNLWNSLLNATSNHGESNGNTLIPPYNHNHPNSANPNNSHYNQPNNVPYSQAANPNNAHYNQFVNNLRKTGLTPNESNIRSGLTPGGVNHPGGFPFGHVPGLTTPSALLNSPMTPGLSSLLGLGSGHNNNHSNENAPPPGSNADIYNMQSNNGTTDVNSNSVFAPPLPPNEQSNGKTAVNTHKNPISTTSKGKPAEEHKKVEVKIEDESKRKNKAESTEKSKKRKVDTVKAEQHPKPAAKKKPTKKDEEEKTEINPNQEEEEGDDEEVPEKGKKKPSTDKRKNFLERNRVAASKCRQRKKQLLQKMEDELAFYSAGYRELSAQAQQLRDQLMNVRGVLVGHKDCSVLVSSVGGYEQLNNIIRLTDYIIRSTARTQTNATSIPSTIPTTLNNATETNGAPAPPGAFPVPPPAPTSTTMAPQLPITGGRPMGLSNSSIETINNGANGTFSHGPIINSAMPDDNKIASRHSFSDLPAAAATSVRTMPPQNDGGQANLRVINSMSNLAGMNQQLNQNQPNVRAAGGNEKYNIRTINSMIDLQQHNPHPQTVSHQNFGIS